VVVVGPVPPSVTYIGVESGRAGASVPIIGSALEGATEVRFGGRPAPSFTALSAIEIVAQAPEGEGTVDVTVTTPAGTSRSGYGDLFSYLAPAPMGSSMSGSPPAEVSGAAPVGGGTERVAAEPTPVGGATHPARPGARPRAHRGRSCGSRHRRRCETRHRHQRRRASPRPGPTRGRARARSLNRHEGPGYA
jgi:hypothetical protein